MAKATDAQPPQNLETLDFETDFETAFQQAVVAGNKARPAASGDSGKLTTPRIECEFLSGAQEQRSYIVPGTNWRYPDVWSGSLKVSIVTNRLKDDGKAEHRRQRALVRWISQNHAVEISDRMKYLTAIQIIESGTSREFRTLNDEDISGLSFAVKFNIHPSAFPKPE